MWSDNLIKIVYFTKANAILCSLTNPKYNDSLISGLLDCSIHPLDLAFMKRSQLLSARFEDMEVCCSFFLVVFFRLDSYFVP